MKILFDHCREITNDITVNCEEEGKEFILNNNKRLECWKIGIDKKLLGNYIAIQRCDFGIYIPTSNICYLIELKGKRIEDAIAQINATLSYFHWALSSMNSVKARVVAKDSNPKYYGVEIMKLRRLMHHTYKGNFENYTCDRIYENLV